MRVALVSPEASVLYLFHRNLVDALLAEKYEVFLITSHGPYVCKLVDRGACHLPIRLRRFINPLSDFMFIIYFVIAVRRYRFDVVHNFTVKPNLYVPLVAKLFGVGKVINTVEGMGLVFSPIRRPSIRWLKPLIVTWYRSVNRFVDRYWFVNAENRDYFLQHRLTSSEKVFTSLGTGVQTDHYAPECVSQNSIDSFRHRYDIPPDHRLITMPVGRLIWSKGIKEFVEAARLVRRTDLHTTFMLVGPTDPLNPDAVPAHCLEEWQREGCIRVVGFQQDMRVVYAASTIVVLPTYYAEGVANVV